MVVTAKDDGPELIAPPGGSVKYRLDATRIRWVPHPGVSRAWVRVHVQSWATAGVAVPIGVRCYAMNRPHIGAGLVIVGGMAYDRRRKAQC